LASFYDLSNWKIGNVKDISSLFYNCLSLSSIFYTSKWDIKEAIYMSNMFFNCFSSVNENS